MIAAVVRGTRAGHLVRAIDIRANRAYGVFDSAHPDFDGEAFSNQMKDASSRYYGTLGPEFVRQLIDRKVTAEAITEKIDVFMARALEGVTAASRQVKRVAQRFGLVVAAGELAAEFDLVPWTQGVPTADGATLFKSWLSARGGAGQVEDRQMLAQVQRFFEAHGESRFDNLDDPPRNAFTGQEMKEKPSSVRAGYREEEGEDRRWYVLPQIWRDEICAGLGGSRGYRR
jgi:putative DNA primase/helicase